MRRLEEEDNKLLHIIERLSLMDTLVARVSYGRIIADLLTFSDSRECRNLRLNDQECSIFGYLQYRLFGYSTNLLV